MGGVTIWTEATLSLDEQRPPVTPAPLRWHRAIATSFAILFALCIVMVWVQNFREPNVTDYLSFWAAGHLTAAGDAQAAYDIAAHRAVEFTISSFKGVLPFPYPPPFLLLVTPFSLIPYHYGFAAWVLLSGALYALAARRLAPLPYALSQPAVLTNGMIGQNGFLITAIFISGTSMLRRSPFWAGTILGMLVIKPHLALLLPLAVIASKEWRAVAGAALSSAGLTLLAFVLLGWSAFGGFLQIVPAYGEMLEQSKLPWHRLATPFAFARYLGVDQTTALSIHAAIAFFAALLTWIAWRRDWQEKLAILATATLMIPPYLHTYDSLLLIVPLGFWVREQWRPWMFAIVWLLCALAVSNVLQIYYGPNTIPIAAILSLGALVEGRLRRPTRYAGSGGDRVLA